MSGEAWHGTPGGKSNHKCKCPACLTAWNAYLRGLRAKRSKSILSDDPRHGTVAFYKNHGCRCPKCRKASSEEQQARRTKGATP